MMKHICHEKHWEEEVLQLEENHQNPSESECMIL